MPRGAVSNALQKDGLDPSIIDIGCRNPTDGQGMSFTKSDEQKITKSVKQKIKRKKVHFNPVNYSLISETSMWYNESNEPGSDFDRGEIERMFTSKNSVGQKVVPSKQVIKVQVVESKQSFNGDVVFGKSKTGFSFLASNIDCMYVLFFLISSYHSS